MDDDTLDYVKASTQVEMSLQDIVDMVKEYAGPDKAFEFVKALDKAYDDMDLAEQLYSYFAEQVGRDAEGGA